MRIGVRAEAFELTPQLRSVVVSRLVSALGTFGAHIASVGVRLQISTDHLSKSRLGLTNTRSYRGRWLKSGGRFSRGARH
jgi:hypothetical protein